MIMQLICGIGQSYFAIYISSAQNTLYFLSEISIVTIGLYQRLYEPFPLPLNIFEPKHVCPAKKRRKCDVKLGSHLVEPKPPHNITS